MLESHLEFIAITKACDEGWSRLTEGWMEGKEECAEALFFLAFDKYGQTGLARSDLHVATCIKRKGNININMAGGEHEEVARHGGLVGCCA